MRQDLWFAIRLFARQRGFFVTAVLTIALGIGLSATVFAVVDGVLFRPLPYRDPGRLVAIYGAVRADEQWTMPVSYADLVDWRAASRTIEQFEGYDLGGVQARVRGADETTQVPSTAVTPGFFDLLGARAAMGRTFVADDYRAGAAPAAVISYRIWRAALGGDPDVLGRTIVRGDRTATIVGVMPRDFVFPTPSRRFAPEVIVPFDATGPAATERNRRSLYLVGRLAPGATMAQARTELDAVALRLKPLFVPRPNTRPGGFDSATVMDLRDQLTRASRSVLWLVFAAAAAVFLIACLNVVSLLLAQGEDRRRELAVRTAIGAGRLVLMRQLIVEASVLAAAGAATGWLVSVAAFGALTRQVPRWLQLLGDPGMNARTAAFAAIMTVLTVVVAGIVPALRASAGAPRDALAGAAGRPPGCGAAVTRCCCSRWRSRRCCCAPARSCCAAGSR